MKIGIIAAMEQELVLLVEQLEIRLKKLFLAIPTTQDAWANTTSFWCNQVLVRLCQPCLWLSW